MATHALVVYAGRQTSLHYISKHPIKVEDGTPVLGVGEAITKDAFVQTIIEVARAQGISATVWTSPNTIAVTPTMHAWWSPATTRWLHFKSDKIKCTAEAQTPALLWVASGLSLSVFALKESRRPDPETELYQAPFYNVGDDGSVCLGTTPRPESGLPEDWETQFFRSTFTHPNGQVKLCKYRGGFNKLWKTLLADKTQEFPLKALIPLKITIKNLMEKRC